MNIFDPEFLAALVRRIVTETLSQIGWPPDRLSLTEAEAAAACGVGRHVLRDLRLAGRIRATKLGRRVVYTRLQLLRALDEIADVQDPMPTANEVERRARRAPK